MKLFITGANGFIGSYVCSYFLRKNFQVVAAARKFHSDIRHILAKAELLELDLLDTERMNTIKIEADVLIHIATANDVISRNAANGIELSAVGTKNILEFAVRNKIEKCVVFSTLQVYGTELYGTITENSPTLPEGDYALNHLFAEMYAEMYSRKGLTKAVSVRPSNVYGRILADSFDRWTLVPGCFCKEAFLDGTITIKSSGLQMRNFVNLENLSRALETITQHFPDKYECINLASAETVSIKSVAEIVSKVYKKVFGRDVKIDLKGGQPLNSNLFKISLDRLEKFGFTENLDFTLESEIEQIFFYLQSKQIK